MATISQSKIVPYSAFDMFRLVDNVTNYHAFLPWCEESVEHYRDADSVKASLTISSHGFSKSFTTHNLLQEGKMIEIRLVDGPFSHLQGFWRFDAIDDGHCKVSLDLEYEYASKLLGMMINPFFHPASSALLQAFCDEAKKVYGE